MTKTKHHFGDGFSIKARGPVGYEKVQVFHKDIQIGSATVISDKVDVAFVTAIHLDRAYVDYSYTSRDTVSDAFIQFLISYFYTCRTLLFHFMFNVPEYLRKVVEKYQSESDSSHLFIKSKGPTPLLITQGRLQFLRTVKEKYLPELLILLKENTYWQPHLTLETLSLLVQSSHCTLAILEDKIVGFTRVLTDLETCATLWDVVIKKQHRNQGIGCALMHDVFSNPLFSEVAHWILFTETAERLYRKFGFVQQREIPTLPSVHPIRLSAHQIDIPA